jgi:hypothetical protein
LGVPPNWREASPAHRLLDLCGLLAYPYACIMNQVSLIYVNDLQPQSERPLRGPSGLALFCGTACREGAGMSIGRMASQAASSPLHQNKQQTRSSRGPINLAWSTGPGLTQSLDWSASMGGCRAAATHQTWSTHNPHGSSRRRLHNHGQIQFKT